MEIANIISTILLSLKEKVKPGITTMSLEKEALKLCKKFDVKPYNKGYKIEKTDTPFPTALCTSVNDVICHGIPSEYTLMEGDLINLDIGIYKDGKCGDAALTVPVGTISRQDEYLLKAAKESLMAGIETLRDGVLVEDVALAMYQSALRNGFVTNKLSCGHAIGLHMHEKPNIPAFPFPDKTVLKKGMIVCLEPQLTKKDEWGRQNGWDFRTRDGRKSAYFEHMVLIEKNGYKILTTHI